MNRAEMIDSMDPMHVGGVSKAECKTVVDAALASIAASLRRGEAVELKGFGVFSVVETKERPGRNVRTGEAITIPAGRRAKFKASKGLI